MLELERPDAVFCIGGPRVHFEVGRDVLERGFPLYIQKPPALSSEETAILAGVARGAGVVCHVGFNIRTAPAILHARRIIRTPEFGDPTLMFVRYSLMNGDTLKSVLLEQHCHAIDLLLYFFGEPTRIQVQWGQKGEGRAYSAVIGFAGGAVGTVAAVNQQATAKEFVYFEISGPRQRFLTCHDFDLVYRTPPDQPDIHYPRAATYQADRLIDFGYQEDVASFFKAVRKEAEDPCPVADTIATMKVCEEIYRQCRQQGAPE